MKLKMPRKNIKAEEFDELLKAVDHEVIAAEIRNTGYPFNVGDLKVITDMVIKAGEKWLLDDLDQYEILAIEETSVTDGILPVKCIKDIVARLVNPPNNLKSYAGALTILDWKSASGELDARWVARLTDSWQYKIYLVGPPKADLFVYRGVNHSLDTRQLTLGWYDGLESIVRNQLDGAAAMRQSLAKFQVWPMHMPDACNAFGQPCPYFTDCREDTMPKQLIDIKSHVSHSAIDQLLRCPERYRRDCLLPEDSVGDFNTEVGAAFHRGVAALYSQGLSVLKGVELTSTKEKELTI